MPVRAWAVTGPGCGWYTFGASVAQLRAGRWGAGMALQPCHRKNQSVKRANKPDSVHRRPSCENRWRDRHYSGPGVTTTARCYLPANSAEPRQRWPTWYCCAQRLPVSPRSLRNLGGYRVSSLRLNVWLAPAGTRLRGFPDRTPLVAEDDLTRLCCSDPHLAVGSRWLLRCPVQSGRSSSARFPIRHQRRSGVLHGADYRADAVAHSQSSPKRARHLRNRLAWFTTVRFMRDAWASWRLPPHKPCGLPSCSTARVAAKSCAPGWLCPWPPADRFASSTSVSNIPGRA